MVSIFIFLPTLILLISSIVCMVILYRTNISLRFNIESSKHIIEEQKRYIQGRSTRNKKDRHLHLEAIANMKARYKK